MTRVLATSTRRALVFGLAVLVGAPAAAAGELAPDLEVMLERARPHETVDVIVRCSGKVDPRAFRNPDRRARRAALIRALRTRADTCEQALRAVLRDAPGRPKVLWTINGVAARVPPAMAQRLARLPGVERVALDARVAVPAGAVGEDSLPEWNLQAIRAPALWEDDHDGSGIVVATLDTGVDPHHPDLESKWRGGTNSWFDPHGEHATPDDANGHGTRVLGLIVGGDAGGSVIGVAPGARWIAAKIFDDNGESKLSTIHEGLQWTLDPDGDPETDDAPHVVNNSWYLQNTVNACDAEFADDIAALRAADIAVVFPSGNTGPGAGTSVSPSNNAGALSAGAIDASWFVGGFSGRGPSACGGATYPHLVAPGASVRTADLTLGGIFPDSYVAVTGTSFSTAQVAGGLALLRGAMAARGTPVSLSLLESALLQSAVDLGAAGPDNDYGAGLLDLKAAYDWLVAHAGEPVVDEDADGYPAEADCNDHDAAIHPGAPEVKHDGVDQDCNGYDLTIEILMAQYDAASDTLFVTATSAHGRLAYLVLDGYGQMRWQQRDGFFFLKRTPAGGDPGNVTVSGFEGAASASTSAP